MNGITHFSFPTPVTFGPGAIERVADRLSELRVHRPLIVTDPGLRRTTTFERVVQVLEREAVDFTVFAEVHGNPLEEDVEGAGRVYHAGGCDGLIGLGGGSAMDVAKAVAVRVTHEGPLASFEAQAGGVDRIVNPVPPIIAIPTTAGTGSEVGRSGVITIPELGRKVMIFHPSLMPARVIADPELTVSLPPFLTAATGMDAFTHCLESLTAPIYHPICDAIAVGGLELVVRYLERATRDGADIEARGNMMVAAMMGALAFQKDLGAAHSLAHPLSTEYGVHHGHANAVVLPAVMRFNLNPAAAHYARLAGIFGLNLHAMSELEAATEAVALVAALNARLGLPTRLRDCGVPEAGLEALAGKAFADACHKTNVRPCTQADLLELYRESW
jgi:4-hydroxybutyrate dehydrogenase